MLAVNSLYIKLIVNKLKFMSLSFHYASLKIPPSQSKSWLTEKSGLGNNDAFKRSGKHFLTHAESSSAEGNAIIRDTPVDTHVAMRFLTSR